MSSAAAKTSNSGRSLFGALNTNFVGKVAFYHPYYYSEKAGYTIPDADVHCWLYVNDGRNLGGPLASFTHDALTVNDWGRLSTITNDVVLDQANRGVCVKWVGQFDVSQAAHRLTIANPLTLNGELYKRGAGELVLGGQLRFALDDNAAVGTPLANSNLVTVAEGSLRVTATNALDGAAITVKDGARLTVDAAATGDVKAYGFVNVRDGGSLSSDPGAKIGVSVKLPDGFTRGPEIETAICTVRADSPLTTDSFRVGKVAGYSLRVVAETAGGNKTFKVVGAPSGFVLIYR